jgi:peptidoglycan/LPS O-acetylase OafA/YrhL
MAAETPLPSAPQAAPVPAVPARLTVLDGLRGLAALYVVCHHAYYSVDKAWKWTFFNYGHYSVAVFMLLSGFGLMFSALRNGGFRSGIFGFYRRRIIRFFPPYYASLALTLLLIALFLHEPSSKIWAQTLPVTKDVILDRVFLNSRSTLVNYPYWSLSSEVHLYLIFPLLFLAWRFLGFAMIPVAFVLSALPYRFQIPVFNQWFEPSQYIALFVFGMGAASVVYPSMADPSRPHFGRSKFWPYLTLGMFTLLFFVFTVLDNHFADSALLLYYTDLLVGIALFAAVITICQPWQNVLSELLEWKPFQFLGTISYSLYLIHAPLLQLFRQYVLDPFGFTNPDPQVIIMLLVAVPLTIPVSYWFYLVFERPFQRLAGGKNPSRPMPAPVAVPHQASDLIA